MERTQKVALVALLVNAALVAVKVSLAFLSGSLAVMAEAIHSVADLFATGAVLVGLKVANRKSRQFPYGLYKVENVVALFISAAILWAGYEVAKEAVAPQSDEPLRSVPLTLVMLVVSAAVMFGLARYKIHAGREAGSPSLLADGVHSQVDVFSTLAVVVGLAGSLFGLSLDRAASVVVVLFIAKAGYDGLVDALRVLLDASLDYETLDEVRETIEQHPLVDDVLTLTGRNSGRFRFIEAEISLRTKDLDRAHAATRDVEKQIREQLSNVEHLTIHYQPVDKPVLRHAIPVEPGSDHIDAEFGAAKSFLLLDVDAKTRAVRHESRLGNPYAAKSEHRGLRLAEFLLQNEVDVLVTRDDIRKRGPGYALGEAGVEVYLTEREQVAGVLAELRIKTRS